MDILYIVIPAYNESENIKEVIEEWYPLVERYHGDGRSRLVIVNDGSEDDTLSIMCREAEMRPFLTALTKENGGHGDAVLFGYQYAVQNGADYIFQTDSDRQTNPNEFSTFWEKRKKYEAIIGYRNHRKDGITRIFVTKILQMVVFLCFGVWVTDANAPFRLMQTESLKQYLRLIPEHYNLPNVIISTAYVKFSKNRATFVPITFRERQGGVNSINLKKISVIGRKAVFDFWKIKKSFKHYNDENIKRK